MATSLLGLLAYQRNYQPHQRRDDDDEIMKMVMFGVGMSIAASFDDDRTTSRLQVKLSV